MSRVIGLDISKQMAEVAILRSGETAPQRTRFPAQPAAIARFASSLGPGDRVALESCTNAVAFHRLLSHHAGEVVISNPLKTRIIAEAKVKTDKVDAEILARLRTRWPRRKLPRLPEHVRKGIDAFKDICTGS